MAATSTAKVNHGLTFIALLAFAFAFLVARIFTTVYPDTVVVSGGIHLHHFWYGLAMVVTAGWLGIVYTRPALNRVYALGFGFGGGLIGDEVGLLLTFGNYDSQLTYDFIVGLVCFVGLAILVIKYGDRLEDDVLLVGRGERLAQIGIAITASSALGFAFDMLELGLLVAIVGIVVLIAGILMRKKPGQHSIEGSRSESAGVSQTCFSPVRETLYRISGSSAQVPES